MDVEQNIVDVSVEEIKSAVLADEIAAYKIKFYNEKVDDYPQMFRPRIEPYVRERTKEEATVELLVSVNDALNKGSNSRKKKTTNKKKLRLMLRRKARNAN